MRLILETLRYFKLCNSIWIMGFIKVTHRIFCHAIFFNQTGMILKSATCPLRSRVLRLTEASSRRPDSPRTSPQNETVKLSRRQMIVANYPMVSSLNMMPDDETIHDVVIVCRYKVISRIESYSTGVWLPPGSTERHQPQRLTVWQFLYSSGCKGPDGRRRRMQRQNFDSGI